MKLSKLHLSASRSVGLACIAAAAFLAAGGAQAQAQAKGNDTPFFGEIGYSALTYKEPLGTAHPKNIRLLGGYELNPNLAVEAQVLLNAKEGKANVDGVENKLKVDSVWGLFLKPKVTVMPDLEIFGRLGVAHTKLKASTSSSSVSDSGNSFAYGLGVAYAISDKVTLSLDYMSYYDRDDKSVKGPTLGLGIKF